MAEDDLRYPSLAYEYEEVPDSELEGGVGVMPGGPLEEVKEDDLISGRGLIP